MNPDLSKKAIHAIETICESGCAQVNQLIDDAKNGRQIDLLAEFDATQSALIINELSEIMSVYKKKIKP